MRQKVYFRDDQEQQAQDHTDLQDFAEKTFDDLVRDAVTATRRYAGFTVTKTAQVEVQVQAGRFFDVGGAVYHRDAVLTQSLLAYLAAASKRIVVISASGVANDTEVEERDFLIDADTNQTEPDSVPTVRSRDAVLSFTQGTESADPQPPAIPTTHVAIAQILLDTTQVVSVTMLTDNRVESTENLDVRAKSLEVFRANIEPRVNSLASDLAALANKLGQKGQSNLIVQLMQDMGRVKARLEIPDNAVDYGADRFLDLSESDHANAAALGYDCLVEEGVRFPDANADEFEMDIFSANDPNAAKAANGLLLPAYESILKMQIGPYHSDLGIAQYGFQTFDVVQREMSRQRIRYGSVFTVCTNNAWWQAGSFDSTTGTFQKDGETFELVGLEANNGAGHEILRLRQVWVDTYTEPYWDYVVTEHSITGAQVAQSFLVANDMWLTKVGFYLTVKAANEAVHLTVCEITNGVPDLDKAILHQTVAHGSLEVNGFTRVNVTPTFLKSGKRYALVMTSNANHKIGMASGQQYLDGTFFYSTDGAYFQGDLTKDMLLELWGARFAAPQVSVELEAINLDGGIRNIDILAGLVQPASTELIFEVRPSGSGAWYPIAVEDLTAFNATPPLAQFRARFVGTRDMMPGLMLTGSRVKISRPKTALKHVSDIITLGTASDDIYVKLIAEGFSETPHDLNCQMYDIVGAVIENPDATTTVALADLPNVPNRIERTFRFQIPTARTTFRLIITGSTNSAGNTFNVSERVHWVAP